MRFLTLALTLLILAGCGLRFSPVTDTPTSDSSETALNGLFADLRAVGVNPEPVGPVSQPFFPVTGRMLRIYDERIQVYVFTDAATREAVTAQIAPDGMTIAGTEVSWLGTPHFYRRGTLIVLYVGDNYELTQVLAEVLGPQFAGGTTIPEI